MSLPNNEGWCIGPIEFLVIMNGFRWGLWRDDEKGDWKSTLWWPGDQIESIGIISSWSIDVKWLKDGKLWKSVNDKGSSSYNEFVNNPKVGVTVIKLKIVDQING